MKELVLLAAIDAAATHLLRAGTASISAARSSSGATEAELLEVLQLTSTIGIHSVTVGVPILLECAAERPRPETRR